MRVSVVVPAYNAAWSIGRTIRSLRAQHFADFEAVIVNDGSTDALHETVATATEGDPRFRIVDQPNRGLAAARNRGIAETSAALVAMLDADDIWYPNFLARLVPALEAAPEAPFAYAASLRIDETDRVISALRWREPPRHDQPGLIAFNSVGNGSAALFRRTVLEALGGYDESLRPRGAQGVEDWKLAILAAGQGTPVFVTEPLVGYRLVTASMSQADPDRQFRAVEIMLADVRVLLPEIPARHFAAGRIAAIVWLLPAFLRRKRFARAFRLMAEAYLLNPRAILRREMRHIHLTKLRELLSGLPKNAGH